MRRYQAVLILDPDIEEKALSDFREVFNKLLKGAKAENVSELENDVRDLAHPIKKRPRARFWRVAFDANPGSVASIKSEIRHDERMLRQMYFSQESGTEIAQEG
ncbi:30S ribosomal protein S6 [bacterium]|nr:30S ribosomal protein S6 [bacterium]